ncbi:protein RETICULATA-RELATED 1, chloroplastic-like isoform X2 [Ziziphus jujuba]|uniref:Protein RETICULATA-RELATED 1, chloroplastic-like isoform X2 n=1 Tax=Ziziphus jujuba TaxID=326968 RepID=A0ABM3ZXW4_ZIZJJ|nr:protein RETICULATA-RELATED 1, chloroplastic-like isoform X2 [Ziziphus jujuba]
MAALVVSGTSPSAPSTSRSTIANYANKLKDQVQESESHSAILQQKVLCSSIGFWWCACVFEFGSCYEWPVRMLADPSFLYRLLLEQATTIGCSVCLEFKNRKDRVKREWDLALVHMLTVAACDAIVVWLLATCRSYGNVFQFDLQNTLQKLPNNIFERSYPLREFDLQKRIHSFFYKAAEFCMAGLTAGAVQGSLSNYLASKEDGRLSVSIPSTSTNALGYGGFPRTLC